MKVKIIKKPQLHHRHRLRVGDVLDVLEVVEPVSSKGRTKRVKGYWVTTRAGERVHLLEFEAKEFIAPKYRYSQ